MAKNQLVLNSLREKDRLVSTENEVFEVVKALGRNSLCCKNELAFRLGSIDKPGKEIVIIGGLNAEGQLNIDDFKNP